MNLSRLQLLHRKFALLMVWAGLLYAIFLFAAPAFAQDAPQTDPFGVSNVDATIGLAQGDVRVIIGRIIQVALGLLGIIAVSLMIYAGFMIMTAGGNEERVTKGKKILINATIGIAIILSSFTIVTFFLSRLSAASKGGGPQDKFNCNNIVECNGPGGFGGQCIDNHFQALSVTPSQDETGMNNIRIRAVFSKGVGNDAEDVLDISGSSGPGNLNDRFTFSFVENSGRKVVEAVYTDNGECSVDGVRETDRCMPVSPADYRVVVREDLEAEDGQALELAQVCEGFEPVSEVTFSANVQANDITSPQVGDIMLRAQSDGTLYGGNNLRIPRGEAYTIEDTVDDDSGTGFVEVFIGNPATNDGIARWRGPAKDESGNPFQVSEPFIVGRGIPLDTPYLVRITVFDIDNNANTREIVFTVGPERVIPPGGGCQDVAGCNPPPECIDNVFAAMSITPSQPSADMNNLLVRAVFNRPVGSEPAEVFTIKRDGQDVTAEFEYRFSADSGRRVVEAIARDQLQCAAAGLRADDRCVPLSNAGYVVDINSDITAVGGRPVDFGEVCAGVVGLRVSEFSSVRVLNDTVPPQVGEISLIARSNEQRYGGGDVLIIPRNEEYTIDAKITDTAGDGFVSGIGFAEMVIENEDGSERVYRVDGPAPQESAGPFEVSEGLLFSRLVVGRNFPLNSVYSITITGHDIDGNTAEREKRFKVIHEDCFDGIQNGDETGVDTGGRCGGAGGCTDGSRCASGVCEDGQCVDIPRIDDISPRDGSFGSFMTIAGKLFGEEPGAVVFRYDANRDGVVAPDEPTVPADFPQCGGADSWHSSWAVVAVPFPVNIVSPGEEVGLKAQVELTPAGSDRTAIFEDLFTYTNEVIPGLCGVEVAEAVLGGDGAVLVAEGAGAAPPRTLVRAAGVRFGEEQAGGLLRFGDSQAPVTSWADSEIRGRIPGGLSPGRVGVFVEAGTAQSNGIPFDVLGEDLDRQRPDINFIDPAATTAGSFVTLFGTRFDGSGVVYMTQVAEKAVGCLDEEVGENGVGLNDADCIQMNVTNFPAVCRGETWQDEQVVAQVPRAALPGGYFVILENGQGLHTDGSDVLTIVAGEPAPGVCLLEPASGPAPLPADADPLKLYGVNFSADPSVVFWSRLAQAGDLNTWLRQDDVAVVNAGALGSLEASVRIPVDQELGFSMDTGPIRLISENGDASNAVRYTVSDCREEGALPGLQCCQSGAEAGRWKPEAFVCEGETRDAGYAWRFTTGNLPNVPRVLEQCDLREYDDNGNLVPPEGGFRISSPSPWAGRLPLGAGDHACLNSAISVAFSTQMDRATLANNIKVYACAGDENTPDCEERNVLQEDVRVEMQALSVEITRRNGTGGQINWVPETWYHVEVLAGATGAPLEGLLEEPVLGLPLRKSRPCDAVSDDETAYCFDFRSGAAGELCTLVAAGITPHTWTTELLGVVQDPAHRFDMERLFDPPFPFYYFVWGAGSQECSVLDADRFDWQWAPEEGGAAKASAVKSAGDGYLNKRGKVTAWADTPEGAPIFAMAQNDTRQWVIARSTLFVDLGDPRVISFWPNCAEACINAELGVTFDQIMMREDYENAGVASLERCDDSRCVNPQPVELSLRPDMEASNGTRLVLFPHNAYLEPDTWYTLSIQGIRGVGAFRPHPDGGENPPIVVPGKPMVPFQWKFRTKDSAEPCVIDHADVEPADFLAVRIGETNRYVSRARGAPDACNADGQILNPWDYGWSWSTVDALVAGITHFETRGALKPFCTVGCIPAGSDVERGVVPAPRLCGNGVVESGEDCDIGAQGEVADVSCTFECLRPGSAAETCGNGQVEIQLGEECDEGGDKAQWSFCTADCRNAGSSRDFDPDNVEASWCGSGDRTLGEDCDIADPDPLLRAGCSENCTKIGTSLAQSWCDANNSPAPVCREAVSVCGNGIVESGEECEVVEGGATEDQCNARCRFDSVCDTPALKQCDFGDAGCTQLCTFAGASVLWDTPSFCGDGVVGAGEAAVCELQGDDFDPARVLGENPVQIATAIGQGQLLPGSQTQQTTVNVTANTSRNAEGLSQALERPVAGAGDYALQCGYSEYPEAVQDGELFSFNDCPNARDGVADNSCCYSRPMRTSEYPVDGTGMDAGSPAVCRNTFLEVRIAGEISEQTLDGNISIVRGRVEDAPCAFGETDVTERIVRQIPSFPLLASALDEPGLGRFFARAWDRIASFVRGLFGEPAQATLFVPNVADGIARWCEQQFGLEKLVYVNRPVNGTPETVVGIYIDDLLDGGAYYGVLLKGGRRGIKDVRGVGIGSPNPFTRVPSPQYHRDDIWLFKTTYEICRLESVSVSPQSRLFHQAGQTEDFFAQAVSTQGSRIVSTPAYEWEWQWRPEGHPVFRIPVENTPGDQPFVAIGARDLEGTATAFGIAHITADASGDSHLNRDFEGRSELQAIFCESPWPPPEQFPFRDDLYNFRMSYCADAGRAGVRADDLPYLQFPPVVLTRNVAAEAASIGDETIGRKYFFFTTDLENENNRDDINRRNADVIGVQIFNRPSHEFAGIPNEEWFSLGLRDLLSHRAWNGKFGDVGAMQDTTVGGHTALIAGNNYFVDSINVLPEDPNDPTVFRNIFQFILNDGASDGTREVFDQLIESLEFTTNVTDLGYCMNPGANDAEGVDAIGAIRAATFAGNDVGFNPDLPCVSDYNCVADDGARLAGTNGVCNNARTKILRDIDRLQAASRIQAGLAQTRAETGRYPRIQAGSFLEGMAMSRWPVPWNALGDEIGLGSGIPRDPLNLWTLCGDNDPGTCWDQLNSTFICPALRNVFAYDAGRDPNSYTLHGNLEYFRIGDTMVGNVGVDRQHFTTAPQCAGGQEIRPVEGVCGDGAVNPGEQCDPPGGVWREPCDIVDGGRGSRRVVCTALQCQADRSAECVAFSECGNDRVEGGEVCDDGALNGTYGHCNDECHGLDLEAGFCGNNALDRNAQGRPLEYCDEIGGVCKFMTEAGIEVRPEVYILLDRSGSMRAPLPGENPPANMVDFTYGDILVDSDTNGDGVFDWDVGQEYETRWAAANVGLDAIGNQMSGNVDFGMAVFSNNDDCNLRPLEVLEMNSNDADQFSVAYADVTPNGGTPTDRATLYVRDNSNSIFSDNPAVPKMVVLITDGSPACGGGSAGEARRAASTTEYISDLRDQGISTHVVGFASVGGVFEGYLNAWARAGGTDGAPDDDARDFYFANDADGLVSIFNSILSCSQYNRFESASCAWDCQGPGGFCGDGVAQRAYEVCDDGNDNPSDGCTNACESHAAPGFVGSGPLAPAGGAVPGSCGDGAVQTPNNSGLREVCDLGAQNGIACDPVYGQSCSYCSFDCRNVLTVDPAQFCGDGVVNFNDVDEDGVRDAAEPFLEQCEQLQDGAIRTQGVASLACNDRGEYVCSADCQTIINQCVTCGARDEGVIARAAFVNPMVGAQSTWGFPQNYQTNLYKRGVMSLLGFIRDFSQDNNNHPRFSRQFTITDGPSFGIETSEQCSDEYSLYFNTPQLGAHEDMTFPYSVAGEGAAVDNEYVVSPAVPQSTFRVVVRWTKAEQDRNAEFMGVAFSERFGGAKIISATANRSLSACTQAEQSNNYWVPKITNPILGFPHCEKQQNSVFVHPTTYTESRNINVQSMTIDTAGLNDKPLAFLVQGLNGHIGSQSYKNSNLTVEVYEYHEGQNPANSVYKPTRTFSVRSSAGGANQRAQYWHVFNLVHTAGGSYEVQPVVETLPREAFQDAAQQVTRENGSIETDICQVRANMNGLGVAQCP